VRLRYNGKREVRYFGPGFSPRAHRRLAHVPHGAASRERGTGHVASGRLL